MEKSLCCLYEQHTLPYRQIIRNPANQLGKTSEFSIIKDTHMTGKNQHVVPHQDGWAVKGEGNQQAELVIHRPDGRIRDKDSYGHDPFPPKG